MRKIWGMNGCRVFVAGVTMQGDVGITGYAVKSNGSFIEWEAYANQHGWLVTTRIETTGWQETFQGSTFNLGLEVATACNRSAR